MKARNKTLNFSKEYREAILSGRKVSTIRLRTSLRAGDKALIVAGGEKLGVAKITSVRRKRISNLTRKDAVMDGFKSLNELIRALERHYGKLKPSTEVSVIHFQLTQKRERRSR